MHHFLVIVSKKRCHRCPRHRRCRFLGSEDAVRSAKCHILALIYLLLLLLLTLLLPLLLLESLLPLLLLLPQPPTLLLPLLLLKPLLLPLLLLQLLQLLLWQPSMPGPLAVAVLHLCLLDHTEGSGVSGGRVMLTKMLITGTIVGGSQQD